MDSWAIGLPVDVVPGQHVRPAALPGPTSVFFPSSLAEGPIVKGAKPRLSQRVAVTIVPIQRLRIRGGMAICIF